MAKRKWQWASKTFKYTKPLIGPITKIHGGKKYLCRRIIKFLPWHKYYSEPFAGQFTVGYNINWWPVYHVYRPSIHIVELDPFKVWMHEAVNYSYRALTHKLLNAKYNERQRERSIAYIQQSPLPSFPPENHAFHYICATRMSRNGQPKMGYSWTQRCRGGVPGEINAWNNMIDRISSGCYCLVENTLKIILDDGIDYISRLKNKKRRIIYCDPPYHPLVRTSFGEYEEFEWTSGRHEQFIDVVRAREHEHWFCISGYRNPIYNKELKGWNRVDIEMPNHSAQTKTKSRRIESLWMNYNLDGVKYAG